MTPAEARAHARGGVLPGWWRYSDDGGVTWSPPMLDPDAEEPEEGEVWAMVEGP